MLWLHDTDPLEHKSGVQAIQGTKAPGEGVCLTARLLHVVDYCIKTLLAAFQDTWGSNRDQ